MHPLSLASCVCVVIMCVCVCVCVCASLQTHAFVILESEEQGEAVATALHGLSWPINSPKRLLLKYLTHEEAQQGIESGKNPNSQATSPRGSAAPERRASLNVGAGAMVAAKAAMAAAVGSSKGAAAAAASAPGRELGVKRPRSSSPGLAADAEAAADGAQDAEPAAKRPHVDSDADGDATAAAPAAAVVAAAPAPMAVDEEEAVLSLDDLFRKTTAKPQLYWLPLTEEQVCLWVSASMRS